MSDVLRSEVGASPEVDPAVHLGAGIQDEPDRARERYAGILLHPTALPGRFGVGDLGPDAHRFVDFLAAAGQTVWQVLPLGPAGYGNSPYSARSAFAGNPLLISPEFLRDEGLLTAEDLAGAPRSPAGRVDFPRVAAWKEDRFRRAHRRFLAAGRGPELEAFAAANASWLPDYVLFMALRSVHPEPWHDWPPELVAREPAALAAARAELADEIGHRVFLQSRFALQWARLKTYAAAAGVRFFGDIPIFVADDSADVWANQRLFKIDARGRSLVVAGVPPDYFSETGQLWGNPVYRWDVLAAEDFAWWVERFRRTFELVDLARIDHFRGFEACWEVPAEETTARHGTWVPGPGLELFRRVESVLGRLPIVAEDLGLITTGVRVLRDAAGFPGMRVIQFAFGDDAANPFLPHNFAPNSVVYTGTHDNDTTRGWFAALGAEERERVWRYLGRRLRGKVLVDALIRLAYQSVADMAIVPMQDVLGLGSKARMNTPAVANGNWDWRFRWQDLAAGRAAWMRELAQTYGRLPGA